MSKPCLFCHRPVPAFLEQKSEGVCSKRCGRALTAVMVLSMRTPNSQYNISDGAGSLRSIERSKLPE